MLSKEKIIISLNKVGRNATFHLVFWQITFFFYVFLVGDTNIFQHYAESSGLESIFFNITFLSIFNALVFVLIDLIFNDRLMRFFPISVTVFLKSVFYFSSAFLVIVMAAFPTMNISETTNYSEIFIELPARNIHLLRFLIYFYFACFINGFISGITKKIGRSNLKNWLLGILNKPKEQERIFMFIDLKGSTTIAEKLLHKKFSHLVQDVFNDLSIIDNYDGEIYQYVGDGAIISWDLKTGLRRNNFLRAFYAFTNVLERRRRYYNRKYGLEPKFKAGVHVGKVMVLQVGQIRRDISYNGDTLNTAARIESKCNEFKQNLMISGDLFELLPDKKQYRFKNVGNIQLRGKKKGVDIYGVKEKN
ncbi:MAG: adenylate/guanylate cyclase domain-containing protein [Salinivirgaceae bacterium]|nr:adenylate/guanylate cyclase domain-containing protein [Salinivirgaceae bacterium]